MNLLRNIAIKFRYFSVSLLFLSIVFTYLSTFSMYLEIYGLDRLEEGNVIFFSFIIFCLAFISNVNRYLLSIEFVTVMKIYDIITLNSIAFLITWIFFYIILGRSINVYIDIFSIFHTFLFSFLSFLHFKKFNILKTRVCKTIININIVLFFTFCIIILIDISMLILSFV